ncbi:MAG TPA: efflux RND transporter periplasmic adaptor subunit [Pirellulales bacterium]|nr:efflux RND transporter periplasmic adaptor subunit [Pirellulales bacterium]
MAFPGVQSNRASVRGRRPWRAVLFVAAALAAVAAGIWSLRDLLWPTGHSLLIVERAKIGPFVHDVVERGEVESSANVNVVCEVQAPNSEGVRIIEIVPEGSLVEAGDFLVKLDDAVLRTDRAKQLIDVNTSQAALAEAQNELEALRIAKEEYELGTFKQEEAELESELLVAQENIHRAQSCLKYSRKMFSKGYIDRVKFEADQFAVEKYRKELEVAGIKLDVLRNFTRAKTIKEHETDIRTAEAKVSSEQAKHQVELDKLALIEKQLEKCQIKAPIAGQVVYAEMERWRSNGDSAIRPGTRVREQQVIIRLPDPKKMQVKARISEARVDRVKPDMTVKIDLDALPGLELHGRVKKVNPYPSSDNWFNSNVKEYATFVEILDPPQALRPGMSAHVAIRVETRADSLQVPVQAVVERGHKFYCLVRDASQKLAAREVLIGPTNEKFLVIREGLAEGQEVVMNPRAHLEDVGLPAVDVETPQVETPKIAAHDEPSATEKSSQSTAAPADSSGKVASKAGDVSASKPAASSTAQATSGDPARPADAGPGG